MTEPLHSRIADAMARMGALVRHHETQKALAEGLSPLQARSLIALRRRRGMRVGQLAKELLVSYGTLSAAVSSLEEKGLVTKYVDPEEHRAVNLELTRRGTAMARRAEEWSRDLLAPAVGELEAAEAGGLLASLLELIRSFERRGAIAAARMCPSCRHFRPGGGSGQRPHYCGLLDEPIGPVDLQIDCPDHEPVGVDSSAGEGRPA